jgi:hypothetical protein
MNFADLYRISNGWDLPVTPVNRLIKEVIARHPKVGDVEVWACDLNEDVSLGHMTYEQERTSAYSEPYDVAIIRFSRKLNRCWQRAVVSKELMHVFDDSAAKTSDGGKFLKLLMELETVVLPGDASAMLLSERHTEWMALLALCPERLRALYEPDYRAKKVDDAFVADRLKIPKMMVPALMGDYYWRALERQTGETRPLAAKKGHPVPGA